MALQLAELQKLVAFCFVLDLEVRLETLVNVHFVEGSLDLFLLARIAKLTTPFFELLLLVGLPSYIMVPVVVDVLEEGKGVFLVDQVRHSLMSLVIFRRQRSILSFCICGHLSKFELLK